MVQNSKHTQKEMRHGWFCLSLFAILIIAGIVTKRVFGHPEFMMMFHLPAAVFLVLAGRKLTWKLKQIYELQTNEFKKRTRDPLQD